MVLIIIGLMILIAALVQGATGFGFSLIALPLLGLYMPLKEIVPLLVVLSLVLNLVIFIRLKIKPAINQLGLLFIFGIISIPLGIKVLLFMNEGTLKALVGIILIGIAIMMLKGYQINLKNKRVAYALTGVLSGILNGAVSLSGPPVVVLLANESKNKNDFRSALSTLFLMMNIFTIVLQWKSGLLTSPLLIKYWVIFPFLLIGTFIGLIIGNNIDEGKFKKIVLYLLIAMGIMNLI